MFDPGGLQSRLRACPFVDRGVRCFVGRFMLGLGEAAAVFGIPQRLGHQLAGKWYGRNIYAVRIAVSLALRGSAGFEYAVPG